jgi:hypothetical protein
MQIVIYPASAVPDGASGNPDTSLLCLIDIRTMVMSGVAAQHVQPLSSKPFFELNEDSESRRAPGCVV